MDVLWFLVIGLVAGWLASVLVRGRGFGCLGDVVVGGLGAVLGGWLFRQFGVAAEGRPGAFVTALVGALLLLVVVKVVKKA